MSDELRQLLDTAVQSRRSPDAIVPPAHGRRRRTVWAAVTILLLAGGGALAWRVTSQSRAMAPMAVVRAESGSTATAPAPVVGQSMHAVASSVLDASGYIYAARRATVSADTTGRLAEVLITEGARVHKGDLLARLDTRDVERQVALAEAQVAAARLAVRQLDVQLARASEHQKRIDDLHARHFISDDEARAARYATLDMEASRQTAVGQVQVAERQLAVQRQYMTNARIVAPFDALVIERAAQVGEIVSPISAGGGFTRTGICTLVDIDSMEARVRVNEKYIARIHDGQRARITPRAYTDLHIDGVVGAIMPSVERETGTVEVIVRFHQRDARILPNMGIDVSFLNDTAVHASDLAP